jgi:superfamily I DNA/RNA helicase/RecB family exonuclease
VTASVPAAPAEPALAWRLVRAAGGAGAGAGAERLTWDGPGEDVVAHDRGPLLVRGGPGTGKTSLLVASVAARVAAGVDPARIVILTFGRRGAATLRRRIEAALAGGYGRGRVTAEPVVRTFHGYAFGLLRRAATDVGEPTPRLLSGPEQDLVIRELLADGEPSAWPAGLEPALRTRGFASQLRDLLLRAAERGIGAAELARLGDQFGRPDWRSAARFFGEYDQVLALRDATGRAGIGYDSAELVRAAGDLLRSDPDLLAAERHRAAHVYVDEFADTDPAQVDLLDLVAGGGANLVVFGDPDSSIYGFRGADPGAVAAFAERFAGASGAPAPTVTLTRAYRSGGRLLDATLRVAGRLRGPVRSRELVEASGVVPGDVSVHTFRSTASEAAYVAHRLREAHLIDGVPWDRMAVLVKSTALRLANLRRAMHQAGVPTRTTADDLPLAAQPAIVPLLQVLRCAVEPARLDEATAVALLHSPIGAADPLGERRLRQELRALAAAAGDRRPSGDLLVEALNQPAELAAVRARWAAPAYAVAGALRAARAAVEQPRATIEDVLWDLWRATGLAERWAAESTRGGSRGAAADRDLDAVVALFETASRFVDRLPGARAGVFLDHVQGQEVPGDSLAPTADRGPAVRILTAHAAKGLEWDVVVVAGVQEGLWPDLRPRGSVLRSERLVDVVAGRVGPPAATDEAVGAGETAGATVAREAATLLDEERRLFYVAATRARRRLVVTAVHSGDGEEQPSRFLRELIPPDPDEDGEPEPTRLPRALTLDALVAELRIALTDPLSSAERRTAAAAQLRRLADVGVPGADPSRWWGLAELSDTRPLRDEDEQIVVSPSTVELVNRCSLRWLLERNGGSDAKTAEQSVGSVVHDAAMLAHDAETVDRAELIEYVVGRFGEIELSARWLAQREQQRAEAMIDKLIAWLGRNPRQLSAIEREFAVQLDATVAIKGKVDRLEVDDEGRLFVVDLKTGKTVPKADDAEANGQLAAYQAAIEAGAFPDVGDVSGGASLVQLGGATSDAKEQQQRELAAAADPGWAADLVRRTAQTMAASTFHAVANARCRNCPVRHACPITGKGRQVTGGGNDGGAA